MPPVKFLYQTGLFKYIPFAFPRFDQNVTQRLFLVTIKDVSRQCILSQTLGGSHPQIPIDEGVSGQSSRCHQNRHDLAVVGHRIGHADDRLFVLDTDVAVAQLKVDDFNSSYSNDRFHGQSSYQSSLSKPIK